MKRRAFIQSTLAATAAVCFPFVHAQGKSTIKILVGFPAGGAPDVLARLYAEQLRKASGATVLVENRTGASGRLALDALMMAPADGQTLVVTPTSILSLVPQVVKNVKFNPAKDCVPLANLAEYGFAFAVGPGVPDAGIKEFLAWAKANPAKASFATPGIGTPQHFLGIQLAGLAGVNMTHVPYRGGAQAVTDVLGGQVPMLVTNEQLLVPLHAEKKMKGVMVMSPARNAKLAGVPTAKESGFAPLETADWYSLIARSNTPADVVDRLQKQAAEIVGSSEFRSAVQNLGYGSGQNVRESLMPRLQADVEAWTKRVKAAGFTATE